MLAAQSQRWSRQASQRLGRDRVAVSIGAERFVVVAEHRGLRLGTGAGCVEAELPPSVLCALAEGRLNLNTAVLTGRLTLRGPVASLLAVLDVLDAVVHGLLRAPDAPQLHARLVALSHA